MSLDRDVSPNRITLIGACGPDHDQNCSTDDGFECNRDSR